MDNLMSFDNNDFCSYEFGY